MTKKYFSVVGSTKCLALLLPLIFSIGCNKSGGGSVSDPAARNPNGLGPAPISSVSPVTNNDLAAAGSYAILSKTGISNVTGTLVTGHIAVSPAAATYITGFSLVADGTNVFATSSSVVGKVYAADYAVPTPSNLTTAVGAMEAAYTDAAGRTLPDFIELHSGDLGAKTLAPGLYKWGTSVSIPLDVTLAGSSTDIWIFQISGDLSIAAAKSVILSGGALAKNIYWQVAGTVTMGGSSHFEGIILCAKAVTMVTLASMNGRIYSQTAVNLDNNTVTQP